MRVGTDPMRRILIALAVLLATANSGRADTVRYFHLDGLGNVRAITNQAGTVVERHDYLPFGEECTTGPCASNPGAGAGQPRKFTGKERDADTGLDYFGARYCGSKIGRFTTVDPVYTWNENLFDPQRWNRYAYGRNNPFRYVDPDGRAIETPWDVLNIGIGVVSFGANVAAGNIAGAAVDAAGIFVDALATAVPGVPGGAGTAIKAARAADNAAGLVRAGDKASDVVHGIIYLRRNAKQEEYVGKAISEARYATRQLEHAGKHPTETFSFEVLEKVPRGSQRKLDVAEEDWIRAGGGPTRRSGGGRLQNKRSEMAEKRYRDSGGDVNE